VTVDSSILASAGFVDFRPVDNRLQQSDWHKGILHTRVIDIREPRTFVLRFPTCTRGQLAFLRAHYAANMHTEVTFALPRTAEVVTAIYVKGPQVKAISGRFFNVVVTLEEQKATDT
jgi:hypothetical protein